MEKEDLQKVLETIGKGGINVAGDLVLEKKVEYEVNNVEKGGIGIQIRNSGKEEDGKGNIQVNIGSQSTKANPKELDEELLARAIEDCQAYFWGKSSYAVVFCICRDVYGMLPNKTAFEKMVEGLEYKKKRDYNCPEGTIANAFSDNPIYKEHINDWEKYTASDRIIKLRDELLKRLKL